MFLSYFGNLVTDVVALLQCSRYSLGIMASSRGLVAGRLLLQVRYPTAFCSMNCIASNALLYKINAINSQLLVLRIELPALSLSELQNQFQNKKWILNCNKN